MNWDIKLTNVSPLITYGALFVLSTSAKNGFLVTYKYLLSSISVFILRLLGCRSHRVSLELLQRYDEDVAGAGQDQGEEARDGHVQERGDGPVLGQVHDDNDRAVDHAARLSHLRAPEQVLPL